MEPNGNIVHGRSRLSALETDTEDNSSDTEILYEMRFSTETRVFAQRNRVGAPLKPANHASARSVQSASDATKDKREGDALPTEVSNDSQRMRNERERSTSPVGELSNDSESMDSKESGKIVDLTVDYSSDEAVVTQVSIDLTKDMIPTSIDVDLTNDSDEDDDTTPKTAGRKLPSLPGNKVSTNDSDKDDFTPIFAGRKLPHQPKKPPLPHQPKKLPPVPCNKDATKDSDDDDFIPKFVGRKLPHQPKKPPLPDQLKTLPPVPGNKVATKDSDDDDLIPNFVGRKLPHQPKKLQWAVQPKKPPPVVPSKVAKLSDQLKTPPLPVQPKEPPPVVPSKVAALSVARLPRFASKDNEIDSDLRDFMEQAKRQRMQKARFKSHKLDLEAQALPDNSFGHQVAHANDEAKMKAGMPYEVPKRESTKRRKRRRRRSESQSSHGRFAQIRADATPLLSSRVNDAKPAGKPKGTKSLQKMTPHQERPALLSLRQAIQSLPTIQQGIESIEEQGYAKASPNSDAQEFVDLVSSDSEEEFITDQLAQIEEIDDDEASYIAQQLAKFPQLEDDDEAAYIAQELAKFPQPERLGPYTYDEFMGLLDGVIDVVEAAPELHGLTFVAIENGDLVQHANKKVNDQDSDNQKTAQYGRMYFELLKLLLEDVVKLREGMGMVDFGHGIGNNVIQVAYTTGCNARGIELVADRNLVAEQLKDLFQGQHEAFIRENNKVCGMWTLLMPLIDYDLTVLGISCHRRIQLALSNFNKEAWKTNSFVRS